MKLSGPTAERVGVIAVAPPTVRALGAPGGQVAVAGGPRFPVLVEVSAGGVHGWARRPGPARTH
ncbi:hypothetical protein [Lentzea guizhouensis]|uniref:hypothetical protein n=1 Tax=Lentzea guizhouensis TaxID=1586287 RepID=UPI0012B680A9|nr:hypothetical protein [Lentzea guizhouensis]